MSERFEGLLRSAITPAGTEWISKQELLAFNDFLASRGFGIPRMEVVRAKEGKVERNFSYGVLPSPIGDEPEHWINHFDPHRSAEYVKQQVAYAEADGALFDYKVWAEKP